MPRGIRRAVGVLLSAFGLQGPMFLAFVDVGLADVPATLEVVIYLGLIQNFAAIRFTFDGGVAGAADCHQISEVLA